MYERTSKRSSLAAWTLLLFMTVFAGRSAADSAASSLEARLDRVAGEDAEPCGEDPRAIAAHLDGLVRGNPVEAGHALVALGETPDAALRHRDVLLAAVQRCSGDIDLAVVPVGPDWFYPEWTRAEVILIWLADSVRKAEPRPERTEAREYLLDYCRKILENKAGPVSLARAFECAVRCLFYSPLVLIEPEEGLEQFLPVLDAAIDRGAAKAADEQEPGTYCADPALDSTLDHFVGSLESCTRPKQEEFLWITTERRDAKPWRGEPFFSDPTPEEPLFQLRERGLPELFQLATNLPIWRDSYRRAIGYVLSETRRKQAEHIETILKLNDLNALCLSRIVTPVFDVSPDYEKVIVDHLLDFLEAKIKDPEKLAPKPGKWHLTPIADSWLAARYVGELGDPAPRAPHRNDIYQRHRIAQILADALSHEDAKVRIEAVKALCKVVVLDGQCAEIALDPMERELETIEAEEVARAGEFDQYRLNGDTANLYGHLKEALAAAGNMRPSPEAHTQ